MKKPICKLLARMAKDGDIESVAEILEELIDPEPAGAEAPAEPVAVAVASADPAPAVVEEDPVPEVQVSDDEPIAQILQKLDQLIALLTPAAPAVDEDPANLPEELSEVIEETLEAIAAEEGETPEEVGASPEEVAAIVEEVLDPEASSVIDPEGGDDCDSPEKASDREAFRARLKDARPALMRLSPKERREACYDIAAQTAGFRPAARAAGKKPAAPAEASGYDAIAARTRAATPDSRDLGRRIMEKRNPNYMK